MNFISFQTQKSNFGKKKVSDLQITERYLFSEGFEKIDRIGKRKARYSY